MNDTTIYTQSGLQEGISALKAAQKELTTLLEELKGQLRTSLGQWSDNARDAYTHAQEEWDRSAARQEEIVTQLPIILNQIAEGYDATEVRNKGIWA